MLPDFTWKRGNCNCVEHFFAQKEVSQLPTRRLEPPALHIMIKAGLSSILVLVHTQKWGFQWKSREKSPPQKAECPCQESTLAVLVEGGHCWSVVVVFSSKWETFLSVQVSAWVSHFFSCRPLAWLSPAAAKSSSTVIQSFWCSSCYSSVYKSHVEHELWYLLHAFKKGRQGGRNNKHG